MRDHQTRIETDFPSPLPLRYFVDLTIKWIMSGSPVLLRRDFSYRGLAVSLIPTCSSDFELSKIPRCKDNKSVLVFSLWIQSTSEMYPPPPPPPGGLAWKGAVSHPSFSCPLRSSPLPGKMTRGPPPLLSFWPFFQQMALFHAWNPISVEVLLGVEPMLQLESRDLVVMGSPILPYSAHAVLLNYFWG